MPPNGAWIKLNDGKVKRSQIKGSLGYQRLAFAGSAVKVCSQVGGKCVLENVYAHTRDSSWHVLTDHRKGGSIRIGILRGPSLLRWQFHPVAIRVFI